MNITKELVSNFFHAVYLDHSIDSYDPSITFWNLSLNQLKMESFSKYCLINSPSPLVAHLGKNDINQIIQLIDSLKLYHSKLNYEMYSFIIDSNFQYKTDLVGFGISNQIGSMFSVLPIVELSGKDAESINNAILLVT